MRTLRYFFFLTDLGFILYWLVTGLHLLPDAYLFKDYTNPILVAWNWSFLPLDLLVSATGLTTLYLWQLGRPGCPLLVVVSLVLTLCSGLQSVAFWAVRADYDWLWWGPNLYLLVYPSYFLVRLRHHVQPPFLVK